MYGTTTFIKIFGCDSGLIYGNYFKWTFLEYLTA